MKTNNTSWIFWGRFILFSWGIGWLAANIAAAYANTLVPLSLDPKLLSSITTAESFFASFHHAWFYYLLLSLLSLLPDTCLCMMGIVFRGLFGKDNATINFAAIAFLIGGICGLLTDLSWICLWLLYNHFLPSMSDVALMSFASQFVFIINFGLWISSFGFILGGIAIVLVSHVAKTQGSFAKLWLLLSYALGLLAILLGATTIYGTIATQSPIGLMFWLVCIIIAPIWAMWLACKLKSWQL